MTREYMARAADELIAGVQRHSTPSGALMEGDGPSADRMEGVARVVLLAALRLAGSGGGDPRLAAWLRGVLDAAMDPTHPDRWPPQTDHGQTTVEATAVAVALHLTRPWVLEQLAPATRRRLLDWLESGHWCADNNHVLFGALCQAFRHREGEPVDEAAIWAALDRIEEWYVGDGWYSDGEGRRVDHYNAWTFHLYPFWLLDLMDPDGVRTAPRRELYRRRLRAFLEGYRRLFSPEGSFVAMGRSLIYRFGVLAPFWMAEIEGCSPLAPGEAAALTSRCTEFFMAGGALEDGMLNLGWLGPHASILQSYNRPGSPLWAAKGFLGLLLPDAHPAWAESEWAAAEEPWAHSGPAWLTWAHREDGIVRLLNMGSDGHPAVDDPLYRRAAYSSATLPCFDEGLVDQGIAPIGGRHLGRAAGVVRPDSGAQRVRWLAGGRECTVDHAVLVVAGAEIHVARCRDVVALPLAVAGWHAPTPIPSALELIDTDASTVGRDAHDSPDTALGPARLERILLTPRGNELRAAWATGLGAAADAARELASAVRVTWRDGGADVVLPDGTVRAIAFATPHPDWGPATRAQRVHRWT
ncbi:DUF2264 domain-containing protein [Tessaracoccus oleiagri]|uniref:DUF2264 domain-containing protein n=1 Tax=Tessaracoccus oleiagri TaxID=686624 RepID=UPI000AB798A4|nr:DUF2264 domain-containing protein [Tessaracoccus oleiagri]